MRRLVKISACSCALILSPWALAGPPNPDYIASDAKLVFHVDVEAAAKSKIGQMFLGHDGPRLPEIEKIKDVAAEMGIDLMHDIKSITAYGSDMDNGPQVIVAETSAAIDRAIKALEEQEKSHQLITVDGFQCHKWEGACGFVESKGDTRVLVVSDNIDSLLGGVRVVKGEKPAKSRADVPRLIQGTIVYASASDPAGIADQVDEKARAIMKRSKSIAGQFGEDQEQLFAYLTVDTDKKEDAEDVVDIAQAIISIGKIISDDDPDMEQLERILRAIRISSTGSTVELEFRLDLNDLKLNEIGGP